MSTEVPNTPGEEDARRQATASRAALLESWRERLFRDIRVYIYEMHHAMSAAMLAMCTAPIPLYLWWTRYPEFPRAQDIWLYLLVLCGCGAILGVCLELRSTTTSTKLTFNRMIGSLLMCVYAGGSNIALVAYLSRHNPPWEVIAFDLTALVSLVMVFTVPHLFMLMVLGYPFGFLGTSVGRIPGRFSSKAKGLSVEEIQKKIAGAGVTWH